MHLHWTGILLCSNAAGKCILRAPLRIQSFRKMLNISLLIILYGSFRLFHELFVLMLYVIGSRKREGRAIFLLFERM